MRSDSSPQPEIELVGGQRLVVVGAGRTRWSRWPLRPPAGGGESDRLVATCSLPWKSMCSKRWAKPVRPRPLVLRADVVPEIDGHPGGSAAFAVAGTTREPVGEPVILERQIEVGRG